MVGTSVGDERVEVGGRRAGSMSRSGMEGDSKGLRVILRRMNRSIALEKQTSGGVEDVSWRSAHLIASIRTIPLHLARVGSLRFMTISTRS